jgi:hypothetical protein
MTPKEKAKELVEKFIPMTKDWDEENGYLINEGKAIDCALIAIDEIIKEHYPQDAKRCEYWDEVKTEIQKL